MQASFFKRICAYIFDTTIILIIISLMATNLNDKYNEEAMELVNKYNSQEITYQEMVQKYNDINYQEEKENYIYHTINCILTIGYFIVFQVLNKGQTIGKKVFKIKIVKNDDSSVDFKSIILRSIFIYGILHLLMLPLTIKILDKSTYINIYTILSGLDTLLLIISCMFILYRKDKRGLHDIVANTKVVSV